MKIIYLAYLMVVTYLFVVYLTTLSVATTIGYNVEG
jgi:hypothetical protein